MGFSKLDRKRVYLRVSGSIGNFKDKLHKAFDLPEWGFFESAGHLTIFAGLYHWKDYLRYIFHIGRKKVVWAGSDILNLTPFWAGVLRNVGKHYCENYVEKEKLESLGIKAEILPCLVGDFDCEISFKPSKKPKVFMTYHVGREKEYGVVDNSQVYAFSGLSEQNFNNLIPGFQGCYRPNNFDGFSENIYKSILMGQYPLSYIYYPFTISLKDGLDKALKELLKRKEPNYVGRDFYLKLIKESREKLKYE